MLGNYIRSLRKEKNLTLAALSAATNLSPGYLSQVERGIADPSLVLEFILLPHAQDFPSPIYHNTEEIVILTRGEITVMQRGQPILLREGDTTTLVKNVPHLFINHGDSEAIGLSIMTPAIWSLNL